MTILLIISIISITILFFVFFKKKTYENIIYMMNNMDGQKRPFLYVDKLKEKKKKIRIYHNYKKIDNLDFNYYNVLIDNQLYDLNGHLHNWDIIVSWRENKDLFILPGLFTLYEHNFPLYKILNRETYSKDRFCCFCSTHNTDTLINLLSKYKYIYECDTNNIDNYKRYKFVILNEEQFENYITEQIFIALCAGCIPIYIGSPNIHDYVNEQCFINVLNFNTYEECIDYIIKVDSDDTLYRKYISEPIMDTKKFHELTSWYYGGIMFFNKIINKIPYVNVIPYKSVRKNAMNNNPNKNIKIINLEKSVDRHKYISEQFLPRKDLKYEFFSAINGSDYATYFKNNSLINFKDYNIFGWWRNGELGCLLSHCEIYDCLVNDDINDYYCICEDDINIQNMKYPIEHYVNNAPKDWDIIFLNVLPSRHCRYDSNPSNKIEYYRLISNCNTGTSCYIINKNMCRFILNFILPFKMPIDIFLNTLFRNFNIYLYLENGKKVVDVDYSLNTTIKI